MMPNIAILYGTETFNSYECAVLLANSLESYRFKAVVYSMDKFELRKLMDVQVLYVISSTFGNGDNPRNTKHFWKFMLQKRLPNNFLDHIHFSTFGLGDSSYPQYNRFIRKVHARLLQLGAQELSPRGEGDEQNSEGVEAFYKEWEEELIQKLIEKYPEVGLQNLSIDSSQVHQGPKYGIEIVKGKKLKVDTQNRQEEVSVSRFRQLSDILLGSIESNSRLTAVDHFQDVRHITIERLDGVVSYDPGASVLLYPSNDSSNVEELLKCQDWLDIADREIKITQNTEEYHLEVEGGLVQPLTLRSLFTHHLDIMGIPRRSFFMNSYRFSNDDREREKLEEFSKLGFSQDLYDYANRPRRSILETVTEFHSLKIPVEYILDVFPILRPRLYSIASALKAGSLDICAAIVRYKTIIKRTRTGVCTNWLSSLKPGAKVIFSIRPSDMYKHFPQSENPPLLLIGPGTGVAPIRALIQSEVSKKTNIHLFTGNRSRDKDYLYGQYFEELAKQKKIHLYSTFSRDNQVFEDKKVRYFQDLMYYYKRVIYSLLKQKAIIYICGSSGKMPIQTRITLETIIQEEGKLLETEAKNVLLEIENSNRFLQETW